MAGIGGVGWSRGFSTVSVGCDCGVVVDSIGSLSADGLVINHNWRYRTNRHPLG